MTNEIKRNIRRKCGKDQTFALNNKQIVKRGLGQSLMINWLNVNCVSSGDTDGNHCKKQFGMYSISYNASINI